MANAHGRVAGRRWSRCSRFFPAWPRLGLAPKLRADLAKAIHAVAETGVGLLVVDQDIDMLLGLCDRLYLIEQGRVALDVADRSLIQHQDVLNRYFGSAA
jgi:branched-chain amino acid transport system ATP-binding protein